MLSIQPLFPNTQETENPCCTYLGTFDHGGQSFDLWHSTQGGFEPTVIARFSCDGPSYMSGMCFAQPYTDIAGGRHSGNPCLVEARRRALALGLEC